MKTRAGHLRLVPRPIAKCEEPRPYPQPRINGVELRRVGDRWLFEHVRDGRIFAVAMTTEELKDLHCMAGEMLARDGEDR